MEDEFLVYLKGKVQDRLISSFNNTDLLAWGSRKNEGASLLGMTTNIGVRHLQDTDYTTDRRIVKAMQVGYLLSQKSRSVFFAIIYPRTGIDGFKVTQPQDPLNWSKSLFVKEVEMAELIQQFFNTDLQTTGTAKPVNRETSDWFHDWARVNLPREYIRTNIDGLLLDNEGRPRILLEAKRSFSALDSWEPWLDDARNYYLQYLLATKACLKFWTIYHIKSQSVRDKTDVALFEILDVLLDRRKNWISFRRTKTKASELLMKIEVEAA